MNRRPNRMVIVTAFFLMIGSILPFASGQDETKQAEKKESLRTKRLLEQLNKNGINGDRDSISAYFRRLNPNEELVAKVDQLMVGLLSDSFAVRERATRSLKRLPSLGKRQEEFLATHPDPEVRFRGRKILEAQAAQLEPTLTVVFRYLVEEQVNGVVAELLNCYDRLPNSRLKAFAGRVIEKCATLDDVKALERKIETADDQLAKDCLSALYLLQPDRVLAQLQENTARWRSKGPCFSLRVADILLENKNQECLSIYADLLEVEEKCREQVQSLTALRRLTNQDFGYQFNAALEDRKVVTAKWREWIRNNEAPIDFDASKKEKLLGRLLVCTYLHGGIHCFDEYGTELWKAEGENPFACQGLSNGNCVVAMYSARKIVEFDGQGNKIKEIGGLPSNISGIHRLENGNTLLACGQDGNQVLEIDGEGKRVWSINIEGTPTGAKMLENGLILVSLYTDNRVIEIDREGNVIWEIETTGKPYTASRTDTGTTLVSFGPGGIAEYDESGNEVWKIESDDNCYWSQLIDSETVITANDKGVQMMDRTGEVIEQIGSFGGFLYINRF